MILVYKNRGTNSVIIIAYGTFDVSTLFFQSYLDFEDLKMYGYDGKSGVYFALRHIVDLCMMALASHLVLEHLSSRESSWPVTLHHISTRVDKHGTPAF